jgi:deoxyribonuclease V
MRPGRAERFRYSHAWNVDPRQALSIQERLRARVVTSDQLGEVKLVAGVDVAFSSFRARAAAAVLRLPGLDLVDWSVCEMEARFPYVPGLLSFRELPAVLEALGALAVMPDLVLCDGQGLAHPRRFGLACHLGVLTDIPSVGVAKTRLIGEHREVADTRGAWEPLWDCGEMIGAVLRTQLHTRPLYVSIGHRVSLDRAVAVVMRCTTRYRLPQTTRWAHRLACRASVTEPPTKLR